MTTPYLHIYAQEINHDEVYIVGSEEILFDFATHILRGLPNFKTLIKQNPRRPDQNTFCTRDGEYYKVKFKFVTPEELNKLQFPYTRPELIGLTIKTGDHPSTLFTKDQ